MKLSTSWVVCFQALIAGSSPILSSSLYSTSRVVNRYIDFCNVNVLDSLMMEVVKNDEYTNRKDITLPLPLAPFSTSQL